MTTARLSGKKKLTATACSRSSFPGEVVEEEEPATRWLFCWGREESTFPANTNGCAVFDDEEEDGEDTTAERSSWNKVFVVPSLMTVVNTVLTCSTAWRRSRASSAAQCRLWCATSAVEEDNSDDFLLLLDRW